MAKSERVLGATSVKVKLVLLIHFKELGEDQLKLRIKNGICRIRNINM